ncbi:MAG: hypothetical protein ACI8W8_002244 [Rhodothermales bacterium]|jgi:hypothetical protein
MDLDAIADVLGWTRTAVEEKLTFFEPYAVRLHTSRYLEALARGGDFAVAKAELFATFDDRPDQLVRLPGAFLCWRWAALTVDEQPSVSWLDALDLTIMNCVTHAPAFTDDEICGLILGLARQPDRALLSKFFPILSRTSRHRWEHGWSDDLINAVCELRDALDGERSFKEERLYTQLCEICKDFEAPEQTHSTPDLRTITLRLPDAARPTSTPTPDWQRNAQELLQRLGAGRTRETIGRGFKAFVDRGTESISYDTLLGYVWLCESLSDWHVRDQLTAVATRALAENSPLADGLSEACLALLNDDHTNLPNLLPQAG